MNILVLAPHPFYQARGTPIAVALLLRGLSERGDQVEVITYHEGTDVNYKNVTVQRIVDVGFIHYIRPVFSWKKVMCDCLMLVKTVRIVSKKRYDIVHAVEEAVFMAVILKWVFKLPYVYDMDSSLPQQMVDQYWFLAPFKWVLEYCEMLAVRNAEAVIPVCNALAEMIQKYGPKQVTILPDVSLLAEGNDPQDSESQSGVSDRL